ncbi:hypothetical protein FUAX_02500 [Fulvitalea axinellae]|uniref:Uncharacterized protein n=1 Tax=Fulvitalea axinellae TaxID=1182444 RepID=A0AAU9CIL9_9BACT|nr:hypothetical protein FUAX_02500 [Fulvitalea axinellae]
MKTAILASVFFLCDFLALGQVSLDKIPLKNGDYTVGFSHYLAIDSSRTYQREMDWNNRFIPIPYTGLEGNGVL